MDTAAAAAAAAAVARDAIVVVRQKISDLPVGEVRRTATLELRGFTIRRITVYCHISSINVNVNVNVNVGFI